MPSTEIKNVVDKIVKSVLRIVIYPPDSPPALREDVIYEGRGKYESTFPLDRSMVAMLNARLILFDAQIASVEN